MANKIKKEISSKPPEFNEQQQTVINHNFGSCIVCAVAGSGKTTAVVHRISRMIDEGIAKPNEILATTFTKKAANEMNERLKKLGVDTDLIQVSTFHSICYTIIRDAYEQINNKKFDLELDATGSKAKSLLKFVLGYQVLDWKNANVSEVESFIANCKNALIHPVEVDLTKNELLLKQSYEMFEKYKKERKFITFDDLLIMAYDILSKNKTVLTKWQSKFKFVIVDEFQDTNKAQFEIMRLLALPENNIMVVGDDDQSIYSWRGAVPAYMLNFQETFGATIIRMELNYRCPEKIGALANPLIKNNIKRLEKCLVTKKPLVGDVTIIKSFDFDEEAIRVLEYIRQLKEFEKGQFNKIAILYRTNAQSRALEDIFIENNIPYEIVGGMNFYDRKEIKDIIHYFFAALIPEKMDEGFERIMNVPFRFLGRKFIDDLEAYKSKMKLNTEGALKDMPMTNMQEKSINSLLSVINTIRNRKDEHPQDLINWLVNEIDYYNYLEKTEGSSDGENNRISNIKEFARASSKFKSIKTFLEYIETLKNKKKKKSGNKIILSTIHRSKGLEWENVIVVGVNEMILPHGRNLEGDNIEEERRLAYVAITRAKERLLLSYVETAAVMGGIRNLTPSRFLIEMNLNLNMN